MITITLICNERCYHGNMTPLRHPFLAGEGGGGRVERDAAGTLDG